MEYIFFLENINDIDNPLPRGIDRKNFDPYPMFDISDPVISAKMDYQAWPNIAQSPYIPFEPRKIKGSMEEKDSFFRIFTWAEPDTKRYTSKKTTPV